MLKNKKILSPTLRVGGLWVSRVVSILPHGSALKVIFHPNKGYHRMPDVLIRRIV